jgi:hypothetical protein
MIRQILSCFLLALFADASRALQSCPTPARQRVFDTLVAAHSEGVAGAFASSPDGKVLWVAESGSLYVLDDATDPSQYSAAPVQVIPLGR